MAQQLYGRTGMDEAEMSGIFIGCCREVLRTWLGRIETCVRQLQPDQIWWRGHESDNAIGNLVLHLSGNVRQWIVAGVGGAADVRDRDAEFARREPLGAEALLATLSAAVSEADAVLARLTDKDLRSGRRIQLYDVTVLEAVLHVTEHFTMHAGQILYATKLLTGADLGFFRHLNQKSPA